MALTKEQKQNIINKIKESLEKQKMLIFVGISGLKAEDMLNLRNKLKEAGCQMAVVKKTLLKIASKETKVPIDIDKLESEIAMILGFGDEISAAKIANQFSLLNSNLKILGGVFQNDFIGKEKVIELANIPSRIELLAKLLGSIESPISGFINVLQGNIKGLITVLAKAKT